MDCVYNVGGFWCLRPSAFSGRASPIVQRSPILDAGRSHWISQIRDTRPFTGDCSCWILACQINDIPRPTGVRRKRIMERLWREFFSDPSQWWDQRLAKRNLRHPDFRHKKRRDGLFVIDFSNPVWVEARLAALPPGTLRSTPRQVWNRRLSRFVKAREYEKAIALFDQMQLEDGKPDKSTFVAVLNACAGLECIVEGTRIHNLIREKGHEAHGLLGDALVDLYAKCRRMEEARRVFKEMPVRSLSSWNAMIHGYVKCRFWQRALDLWRKMSMEGVTADCVTFAGVLNACAALGALHEGQSAHQQIVDSGLESDVSVHSCLVDMYAKCGNVRAARRVFDKARTCSVASWTAMILGYAKYGEGLKALELFRQMEAKGITPDRLTFMAVLDACSTVGTLEDGRGVHEQILRSGWGSDISLGNSLIEMYSRCEIMGQDGLRVFEEVPTRK